MEEIVLVINPGSTSTKTAVFSRKGCLSSETLRHAKEELSGSGPVASELPFRLEAVRRFFGGKRGGAGVVAVAGRGGPLKPLPGGTWLVNEAMLRDLREARFANHASNLGALIAHELALEHGVSAYVTDPVTTDEMIPEARLSGHPGIVRKSRLHALNAKACARAAAARLGKPVAGVDLVVCHMGGGISVSALRGGRIIDTNDALLGMGPFSPERAGALPIGPLARLCLESGAGLEELENLLSKKCGLFAYLGTADLREVEKRITAGDEGAALVFRAMAYQISKEIGAMHAALRGRTDGLVLTGGMAHSRLLLDEIVKHVGTLAPVFEMPGELEMEALAEGAFRAVDGVEEALLYE